MVTLVGKQNVDFVDRQSGEHIVGIKLHYTAPNDRVSGLAAETKFIRNDNACYDEACALPLGSIEILYGRRDAVVGFRVLESSQQGSK